MNAGQKAEYKFDIRLVFSLFDIVRDVEFGF